MSGCPTCGGTGVKGGMRANVRHAEPCPDCAGSGMGGGRRPLATPHVPIYSEGKTVEDWRAAAHEDRVTVIRDEIASLRREFEEFRDKIGARRK